METRDKKRKRVGVDFIFIDNKDKYPFPVVINKREYNKEGFPEMYVDGKKVLYFVTIKIPIPEDYESVLAEYIRSKDDIRDDMKNFADMSLYIYEGGDIYVNSVDVYSVFYKVYASDCEKVMFRGTGRKLFCDVFKYLLDSGIVGEENEVSLYALDSGSKKLFNFYKKLGFEFVEVGSKHMHSSVRSIIEKCM